MRLGVVPTTTLFQSILQWLRAGYPAGVPGHDPVPPPALVRAAPLTVEQIKEVVQHPTAEDPKAHGDGEITRDEIAEFIKDVTHHDAGPENVQRVAAKLAAAGWALSGISGDAT